MKTVESVAVAGVDFSALECEALPGFRLRQTKPTHPEKELIDMCKGKPGRGKRKK